MSSIPDPENHVFSEWILFGNYYYQAVDIVGFGWKISVENVRDAYKKGVFPWHIDGMPLPWFCPEQRAVIFFEDLHIPRSLVKEQRKGMFRITIDKAFRKVVENCSEVTRSGQDGTWITPEYIDVYEEVHRLGEAHSIEVWEGEELVGGLYGVDAGGLFCGESMFFKRSNASKLAFLHLIDHLKTRGANWVDIQVMTPHMKTFGAVEISRSEFLKRLKVTQTLGLRLFD
jgi:leucyl/phenylalanyl-tRNA--protein transferase